MTALADGGPQTMPSGCALAEQERARLASAGQPLLSLPHIPDGIDLGALYELAAALRAQGLGRGAVTAPLWEPAPTLDVDALLADPTTHIIVCCGSGGVGKTTTAAAARRARRGGGSARASCSRSIRRVAWPSRWGSPSWTTPRPRSPASTRRPVARSTR